MFVTNEAGVVGQTDHAMYILTLGQIIHNLPLVTSTSHLLLLLNTRLELIFQTLSGIMYQMIMKYEENLKNN